MPSNPAKAILPAPVLPEHGSPAGLEDIAIIEPLCSVFRRALKGVGQKYTPERAMILQAVISVGEARGLFDADELIADLNARVASASGPGSGLRVSKATVYRTLKLLADAGIVQQVLIGADQAHYQLAYGRGGTGLLVNLDDDLAEAVEIPELTAIVRDLCARRGLAPEGHRLIVYARRSTDGHARRPAGADARTRRRET